MIILDKPLDFNGKNIEINFYHRVHVNLIQATKVWMCFIPKNAEVRFPELIVSPIDFNAWEDVWRIVITMQDKVGVVNIILQTLKENSINILSLETLSISSQNLHNLELIVDARRYANTPFDKTFDDRKHDLKINTLRDLRRELLSKIVDNIHIIGGKPRIKINRVYSLYEAAKSYNEYIYKFTASENRSPRWSISYVDKSSYKPLYPVTFMLPELIRESIRKVYYQGRKKEDKAVAIRYLPVSDTKDRFMRIYFFEQEDKVITFALRHQEIVGAVATITAAIRSAEFNILSSHSRVDKFGEKAITDFIVDHVNKERLSIQELKTKLENTLSTPELVQFYRIEIAYPERYNDKKEWNKLKQKQIVSIPDTSLQTTGSKLSELYIKYYDLSKKKISNDDVMRFQIVKQLIIEENIREPVRNNFRLFISAPKDDMAIQQIASSIARKHGLTSVSNENLFMSENPKEDIKVRIENCDFFLGIWIKDKALKVKGDTYYPSAGMIWEWGIAEGHNKISKLLIEKSIDCTSVQEINGANQIIQFKDDLESQIEKALSFFKSKMEKR